MNPPNLPRIAFDRRTVRGAKAEQQVVAPRIYIGFVHTPSISLASSQPRPSIMAVTTPWLRLRKARLAFWGRDFALRVVKRWIMKPIIAWIKSEWLFLIVLTVWGIFARTAWAALGTVHARPIHRLWAFFNATWTGSAYDTSYANFFMLTGTTVIALWIAAFAVLALSRYRPPHSRVSSVKILAHAAAAFDDFYNSWIMIAFSIVSMPFYLGLVLAVLMLIPWLTAEMFQLLAAGLVLLPVSILSAALKYSTGRMPLNLRKVDAFYETLDKRAGRIGEWHRRKLERDGAEALSAPHEGRLRRVLGIHKTASREMRRLMRIFDRFADALFPLGEMSRQSRGTFWLVLFFIAFPKPAYVVIAELICVLGGLMLLLSFARRVIVDIPDALAESPYFRI